jgi:RNA polymerase sigma-70 factor (ECF subfamily)
MSISESDSGLLQRVRAGDARALGTLYDRYTSLLYPVVLRILRQRSEAEDALQDSWLQVWRGAATYDPRRGAVAAWLLTIARSRALDRLRNLASRRRAETGAEVERALRVPDDPAVPATQRLLAERVRVALGSLEPQHRQVLECAYFDGLSQSEIAERLRTPLGTVKSWTRQALARLRELLPREEWV